jgi:hypothetical protein
MIVLIILNIILIILVVFLVFSLFKNKKSVTENICVNGECDEIESCEHEQKNKLKSERVFDGRFITEQEYQQIMNNRKSDISILLKEVDNEYEHLKELCK